jgi:alkaline phosphatase
MNDVGSLLGELLDFDEAIQEALTFAQQHPQETLILVTADHETGGLGVEGEVDFPRILDQPFSYQVFFDRVSAGASLSEVAGEMWGFPEKIIRSLGGAGNDPDKAFIALARKFAQEAGVSWETTAHTAEKVPVFVWGEQFPEKLHENTDIFPFLRRFIDDN